MRRLWLALVLVVAVAAPAHASILDLLLGKITSSIDSKGLAIHLNGELTADQISLLDANGSYAVLKKVAVHWSPFALIRGAIRVSLLTVEDADILRLPKSSSTGGGSSLPSKIDIAKAEITRLTLEPAIAGTQAELAVRASLQRSAPEDMKATLIATEIGGDGRYALDAAMDASSIHGTVSVTEAAGGPVSRVADMPGLGAIDLKGSVAGPKNALDTKLTLRAGPLTADAAGNVDLTHEAANLTVAADAPAMSPRPDVSWQSVALHAQVHGPFNAPQAAGTLQIADLAAGGAKAERVAVRVNGDKGEVKLDGQVDKLIVPGNNPDLLGGAPVMVAADVKLNQFDRPIIFSLHHPLLEASGTAQTGGTEQVSAQLRMPALQPFAAVAGQDLQGSATVDLKASKQGDLTSVTLDGHLGITGGKAPTPALIGPDAPFELAASMQGQQVTLTRLSFDGQEVKLAVHGSVAPEAVALDWSVALAHLAPLDPRLGGSIRAQGHAGGKESDLTLVADVSGDVSAEGQSSGPFTAHLDAQGLPNDPRARVTAQGALLGSPVALAASGAKQPDGAIQVTIQQASWKSASGQGDLTLSIGKTIPVGQIHLAVADLGDFSSLVGQALKGSVQASLEATEAQAVLKAQVTKAGMGGTAAVAGADVSATITGLATTPAVDAKLSATGISAGSVAGASAEVTAKGPENALAVQVAAKAPKLEGAPAAVQTTGTVDVSGKSLAVASLTGNWKGQNIRLLQPVRFETANGITIHDLRLGLDKAVIAVDGHAGSTLDLTASARNVPLSLASLLSPSTKAQGTVSAEAKLSGTASAPTGTIRANASGVRLDTPSAQGFPAANLTATAQLQGTVAMIDAKVAAGPSHVSLTGRAPFSTSAPLALRAEGVVNLAMANPMLAKQGQGVSGLVTLIADISGTAAKPAGTVRARAADVRLTAGPGQALPPANAIVLATLKGTEVRLDTQVRAGQSHLAVAGRAPFKASEPMDLRVNGAIDLAVANPILTASGERITGTLTIAGGVAGTLSAPRVTGGAQLAGGDFRDYVEGAHLSNISARLAAAGDTLRIESLSATAGNGTITGSGSIGVLAAGIPVDLVLTAKNASPLSGGTVTATLDANLGVRGDVGGQLTLGGDVLVHQAEIRVPDKLPTSVATIPVRIAGAPPQPAPKAPLSPVIGMNLTVRAPQQVFVRGRGLNAELGGTISIQGTTKDMTPRGALDLRRGTFNLVGNTLTFDSGAISFNGSSITNPAIHLVAMSTVSGTTATLTVGGTARDPKITLSSQPELPQDQIMALLLFHTNTGQLSPFQIASIAAGLAEISGGTSNFPNPLQGVQNALGLDQLGIGSDANGNPSVQAGRYIGRRLYVGAQQSTGGTGARATVQYDLTKELKLNATAGAGQTTTAIGSTGESNGESVGITYQFQY